VGDDGEPTKRRRVKLLEHYPVADNVFDVIAQHCGCRTDEKQSVAGMSQRCEGDWLRPRMRGDGRRRRGRVHVVASMPEHSARFYN